MKDAFADERDVVGAGRVTPLSPPTPCACLHPPRRATTQVTVVLTIEHDADVDPARFAERALDDYREAIHAIADDAIAGELHVVRAALGSVAYDIVPRSSVAPAHGDALAPGDGRLLAGENRVTATTPGRTLEKETEVVVPVLPKQAIRAGRGSR